MIDIQNLWNELDRRVCQKPVSAITELRARFQKELISHQKLFTISHNVA